MDKKFKIDFENLPVYTQKQKIIDALKSHQVIVVESNTGSGKTTQIPIILHQAGYTDNATIGMTQPRRLAAYSISETITQQLQYQYPELHSDFAQYKIRFDDTTTPGTRIKIMTDGILLQEIKHDKLLSAYSVLIIDEAHERSLNIDFILGLLRNICKQRKDLKIIISSATINTSKFANYFSKNCPVINIHAPLFPITTHHVPYRKTRGNTHKKNNYKNRRNSSRDNNKPQSFVNLDGKALVFHIVEVVEKSLQKKEGNMLIFLSGEKLIKDCIEELASLENAYDLYLLPLYGRLDREAQELVFKPPPKSKTKIIVTTNIAETSITINDISVIIDSGRVKLNSFHHHKLSSSLSETAISKASMIQRAGRAGRTGPGICYRLFSNKMQTYLMIFLPKKYCAQIYQK